MRIAKMHLKNFKRFSDLTIDGIPEPAKLVLLIGANGSGKTCIFDAFNWMKAEEGKTKAGGEEKSYYAKNTQEPIYIDINFAEGHLMQGNLTTIGKRLSGTRVRLIGRSSLRIVPKIEEINYSESTIREDADAPRTYIDYDTRFNTDLVKYTFDINKALREPAFKGQSADTAKIFQESIEPFNRALKNIFTQSEDTSIQLMQYEDALPGQPIKLLFKKGEHLINYDLLSHGEKQVVIILLNFVVRREQIKNSIYFIDEMDAHLNTALQFSLLREIIENWVPDDAQLWTASHSLGFIDYARQAEHAAILDFDDLNFDLPQTIVPIPKDRMEVYEIAVSKDILARLFQGMRIVFVENKDNQYFNNLALPSTIFVPERDKRAVYHKVRTSEFTGIIDRDFLTDEEIADIERDYLRLFVLRYYSIENYLYHPDNLQEYHTLRNMPFDREQYVQALIEAKNVVVDDMVLRLVSDRMSYPFYDEPEMSGDARQRRFKNTGENQQSAQIIRNYLRSDDLETFYKVFPMKNQATQLPQRQHIAKSELTTTAWFRQKIQALL